MAPRWGPPRRMRMVLGRPPSPDSHWCRRARRSDWCRGLQAPRTVPSRTYLRFSNTTQVPGATTNEDRLEGVADGSHRGALRALDVHKDTIMAAVRLPGDKGKRRTEVRELRTWTSSLRELRSWLVGHGVTQVAMEATGVYWKAPWHVLAPEPSFELLLVNAQHVKNLPGRKTDVADAQWLASLLECGLLRGSFVSAPVMSRLRDLTRHRKKLAEERGRETQRIQKVLEDAGTKLDSRRRCSASSPPPSSRPTTSGRWPSAAICPRSGWRSSPIATTLSPNEHWRRP